MSATDTVQNYAQNTADTIKASKGWQMGQLLGHELTASPEDRVMTSQQTQTVITVVTVGLVAIIGILIYGDVESAVGTPSNTDLANAQDNVTSGFGDAMDLVPVVLLVLIASLVIAVVQRF